MFDRYRGQMAKIGWLAAVCLTTLCGAASASSGSQTHSLSGTCSLTGSIRLAQPIGLVPRQVRYLDRSTGTCTGAIDGVFRQSTPVVFEARGSGTIGCSSAQTTSEGALIFPSLHARVGITTAASGVFTEVAGTFRGRVSGTGVVNVTLQGDQASTAACVAGTLRSIGYQLLGRTVTPVVG